ncbi:MAG TPA: stress response translation initiation inhibitor YciH [Burkholderiales bacterium]|jgi:translation initiation factor 1|nr:stress response translation initiation inhibitor YciH [Burkholderiales bacterium]
MKPRTPAGGWVYSTESGRMCPQCRHPLAQCICGKHKPAPGAGAVRVSRQTAGRNGKCVTVVRGLPLDEAGLVALGKALKAACGSGGTVKQGVIEVQGDHCDRIVEILGKRFPDVKRAGG